MDGSNLACWNLGCGSSFKTKVETDLPFGPVHSGLVAGLEDLINSESLLGLFFLFLEGNEYSSLMALLSHSVHFSPNWSCLR